MKKYRHLFFDLDHTLWDFAANSKLALCELFNKYSLNKLLNTGEEEFLEVYYRVNDEKWELYREGKIEKERLRLERVRDTLSYFQYEDDDFCYRFDDEYLQISPYQTTLLPNAMQVLEYLKDNYKMHIITNGFEEVQHLKLKNSGLFPFFDQIITSEIVGVNKPSPKIFMEALRCTGATRKNSLMIGDSLVADIVGARNCGIDQVFYNPTGVKHNEKVNWEIKDLAELFAIL